jgi:hypothetical protein
MPAELRTLAAASSVRICLYDPDVKLDEVVLVLTGLAECVRIAYAST